MKINDEEDDEQHVSSSDQSDSDNRIDSDNRNENVETKERKKVKR